MREIANQQEKKNLVATRSLQQEPKIICFISSWLAPRPSSSITEANGVKLLGNIGVKQKDSRWKSRAVQEKALTGEARKAHL